MVEPSGGRFTNRDVMTLVGGVEVRLMDRFDRLERNIEKRQDADDGRYGVLDKRVRDLEEKDRINATRNRDILTVMGGGKALAVTMIALGGFLVSIYNALA